MGGGTWKGLSYVVVQTKWNGVTNNQRTYARKERIRVDMVPKETESGHVILIATLNIRLGWAGRLETAVRALRQGNIGIRVLQETKLTRVIQM